jgi:hypothetical protein
MWAWVACVLLSFVTLFLVFLVPESAAADAPRRSRLDELMDRRDVIYENLRDLRFEHRAGKFSEKDFDEMKLAMETEAARVLSEMDLLTGGAPTAATRQAAGRTSR